MANATKYPALTGLTYFQWATPTAPNPKLASPIDADDTTLNFTSAPLDENGVVVTEAFLMGVRNKDSYVETIYVPAGALSADGLTATGVTRGIELAGIDFTTGSAANTASHEADSPVFCNITAIMHSILVNALQGVGDMATGGLNLVIGDGTDGTVTIKRGNTSVLGFLRYNFSGGEAEFSDDGSTWVSFNDSIASALVKVSANDTTAGYLNGKLVAGDNVTLTENNDAGNETLTIAASSQRTGVTTHAIYTPAYMTGGSSAENNTAIWDSVSDGEFKISIDGVAYNIAGIDFTSITTMANVATVIQTAIRTATGSTETVVWSTDHFVITSADTTVASAVTVTSTVDAPAGTDISGAGASAYMDSETGRGTATAAVLDPTQDVGKVALLNASGEINAALLDAVDPADLTAKGSIYAASAASTPAELAIGTDGDFLVADSAESTGIKWATVNRFSMAEDEILSADKWVTSFYPAGGFVETITGGNVHQSFNQLAIITGSTSGNDVTASIDLGTQGNLTPKNVGFSDVIEIIFEAACVSSATTNQDLFMGFYEGTLAAVPASHVLTSRHAGFFSDGGTLWASNANVTAQTATDISSGITVTDWHIYKIKHRVTTGQIDFYVDDMDTPLASHTTNLATSASVGLNFAATTKTTASKGFRVNGNMAIRFKHA